MINDPERTIEFEFLRATEGAALSAHSWLGKGEKEPVSYTHLTLPTKA